jgi:hypothetical protein
MPYPDYWPDDSQFRPLHWFLEGFNSTAIKEREAVASLADLSGIEAFLTDKYQSNIGKESVHQTHKGSNEFLVAIGKQVYPEFLVFVSKGCLMVLGWASLC